MKPYYPLILSILVMSSFSCTSIEGETQTSADIQEGVPGGRVLDTSTLQATVTGIDSAKREIMLVSPSGKKLTTKVGSEVVNFDQIQIGDQLKVTLTDSLPPDRAIHCDVVADVTGAGHSSVDFSRSRICVPPT